MRTIIITAAFLVCSLFCSRAYSQNCSVSISGVTNNGGGSYTFNSVFSNFNTGTGTLAWYFINSNNTWSTTSGQQNPTIQFNSNGFYYAVVTIYDSLAGCWASDTTSVLVSNAPGGCGINFYLYEYYQLTQSLDFTFRCYASISNGSLNNFRWRVKQAGTVLYTVNSASLFQLQYTFPAAGSYDITFIAEDQASSCIDSITLPLTVSAANCTLASSFSSAQSGTTYNYTFTNTAINPSSAGYSWSFSTPFSIWNQFYNWGTSISHTFPSNGVYAVSQVVYDTLPFGHCVDTSTQFITVQSCNADFYNVTDTINGINYIYDQSSGGVVNTGSFWDMGDGTTYAYAPGQSFVHNYATPGIYTICLTVTDGLSCTDSMCLNISAFKLGPQLNGLKQAIINPHLAGVNDIQTGKIMLDIFPNPVREKIGVRIRSEEKILRYTLYNAALSEQLNGGFSGDEYWIDVSDLSQGLYILKIADDNGNLAVKRVLIQK